MSDAPSISESADAGPTTAKGQRSLDEEGLLAQLNRGYVCPPDSGPAWRAAHEAGIDMSLIEDALLMTHEERLQAHQRALNLVLAMQEASLVHDAGSRDPS